MRLLQGDDAILLNWDFNPYSIALICTGILSLLLSVTLLLRWVNKESILLGFAVLLVAEWSLFVGFESAVQNTELKILFANSVFRGV